MARIKNNPIMIGVSGMLGNTVIYKQFKGQTLLCNRPEKRQGNTLHQQKMKNRFLNAVAFAKKQTTDPVSKALYQPGPDSKFTSAYAAALADYMKCPVIENVDLSEYHGEEGDAIVIKATDVARFLIVAVSIFSVDGHVIEQGEALPNGFTDDYVFKVNSMTDKLSGSKIVVTVKDRPGNTVVKEIVI